jgi:uncharacterized repeat protein (TIGR01451 family)
MAGGGIGQPYPGETMNRTLSILILGLLASLTTALLAGCSMTTGDNDEPRAERSRELDDSSSGTAQRRRTREERNRDARDDSADSSRVALAYPTGNRATSAVLVERMSPPEVRLGEPYEYQIKVTNLTNATLSDVVIREKLPSDFTISRAEPQAKVQGDIRAFELGDLPAKQSRMIRISGTPSKAGSIDSCVVVAYTPTLCSTTSVINPILKITKEAAREADVCEPIAIKYLVSNVGTGTERNVRIEEKLPEGLTAEDGRNTVAVDVGDLPEGKTKEVTVRLKAARAGTFTSEAVARGGGKEVISDKIDIVVRQPKLEVTLRGPSSEYLNKRSTYQAIVKNLGDAPARRVMVRLDTGGRAEQISAATPEERSGGSFDNKDTTVDNRPAGTISRSAASVNDSSKDLGTLAPGESRTVDFNVRMLREGEMKITAFANAECASAVETSLATNVGTLPALRLEVVDVEDAIKIGENVVYRINVKNQGSGDDQDIRIVATLPDEATFVSASGATNARADGQVITFEPVDRLEPEKTVEWRIEAKANRPGDVRFEVKMTSRSLPKPATETEPTRLY